MESLLQDLRYGIRSLWQRPGFTAIAVITLALGIGANTTLFSFVNGILLRPLPYKDPSQLVILDENAPKQGIKSFGVSYPNFVDWRQQNHVFEDVTSYQPNSISLVGAGEPERLPGARISHGLFELLGVAPSLGRTFTAEEDQPETDNVVIIGHGLWQRRFAAADNAVGQTLTVNGRARTIIGVMPPDFKFPETAELWVPLALNEKLFTRTDHGLNTIARLKPNVTLGQARAEMSNIARHIEEQNPVTNEGLGVDVWPLRDRLVGDYRDALLILLGVVAFVLLIACANVANLLLARSSARHKELALRAALGASRTRIVRQLLTESALLSVLGALLGVLLAVWGKNLLLAAIPGDMPFWMKFDLDLRVLGFTLAISFLTALAFGIAPALQASRTDLNEALKEGGRSGGTGHNRMRNLLVVAEVALSLVLLVGAGLMARSFAKLGQVHSGFNPENVLTLEVPLTRAKYPEGAQQSAFFHELMTRIGALPGVSSAAATSDLPLRGGWGRSLTVEGRPVQSVGQAPMINHAVVTPNYFRTLGIPLLEGRDFTEADQATAMKVTIVDERLARQYWPGESPLGKRIRFGPPESNEPWHTIVGVAGAVRHARLDRELNQTIYVPYHQIPVNWMAVAVRTTVEPRSLAGAVKKEVLALDKDQPTANLLTMKEIVSRSIWQQRFYAMLFGLFAALALVLAAVGIYGVMSYAITQRTHEIGIRMALGADRLKVLKLTLGQGMKLALTGVVLGLVASYGLTRLMSGLLFGVSTTDTGTFVSIAVFLVGVTMLACYLPARRATKVDPLVALRYE
ncbi:MAG TPA: ABC transporter permease [Pyrinomonadaceae bacterium]|nr:ABC transporter permease [Pyrinomonadaceae bacterium]